jgi:glycosyltransferase involved in cell wall biosynthesis
VAARLHRPFISNQRSSLHGRNYLRSLDFATQRYVTRYVVQTAHAKRNLQRRGLIPAPKITVIPNLVAEFRPANTRPAMRRQLGISNEATIITCVSNLRPGKGQRILLEAFHKIYSLLTTHYSLQLLLIGDGPRRQALKTLAKNLGIAENIHWLGLRRDVSDLLAASDIFVLPSEAEGMSNALLEAMSAGLPCITSDISANRALITDKTTGILFSVNDSSQLASTLQQILGDPPLRRSLGLAARQYVETHHRPARITEHWRALLASVVP